MAQTLRDSNTIHSEPCVLTSLLFDFNLNVKPTRLLNARFRQRLAFDKFKGWFFKKKHIHCFIKKYFNEKISYLDAKLSQVKKI